QELFDEHGQLRAEFVALAPTGRRRMGANPHANGGQLMVPLSMPHFRSYAVEIRAPGAVRAEATRVLGRFLRDVMSLNRDKRNFRLFGPDETASNRPMRFMRPAARNGWRGSRRLMSTSAPPAASWRC